MGSCIIIKGINCVSRTFLLVKLYIWIFSDQDAAKRTRRSEILLVLTIWKMYHHSQIRLAVAHTYTLDFYQWSTVCGSFSILSIDSVWIRYPHLERFILFDWVENHSAPKRWFLFWDLLLRIRTGCHTPSHIIVLERFAYLCAFRSAPDSAEVLHL